MNVILIATGGGIWVTPYISPPRLPLAAQMVYDEGDYSHALRCHDNAKTWAKENGLTGMKGLSAFVHPPDHPESPSMDPIAPDFLLDSSLWTITVEFRCEGKVRDAILALTPPPNARFVVCGPEAGEG